MTETTYAGGGFSRSTDHLSPAVANRVLHADAMQDRQAARVERARAEQAERRQEVDIAESVRQAEENGEIVGRRGRREGIGHTRQEFVALASARSDFQDAQDRAREQAAYRRWLNDGPYADNSAPTAAEVVEGEVIAGRAANYRAKRRENSKVITAARGLARMDRESSR